MMKRFKAIYLMLILGFLWIGAAVAAYMLLLSPEIQLTKDAATKYESALGEMNSAITTAQTAYQNYGVDLQAFVDKNNRFHKIQETQPAIYSMSERFEKSRGLAMDGMPMDQKGLRLLYQWMAAKKYTNELRKWVRGYNVKFENDFVYNFNTGPMGYEDTFTSVRLVEVNFGTQEMVAFGYQDLLSKINQRTGYKYFPMIISGASAPAPEAPPAGPGGEAPVDGVMPPTGMPGNNPGAQAMPPPVGARMNSPSPALMRGQVGPPPADAPGGGEMAPPPGGSGGEGAPGAGGAEGGASAGSFGTLTITVDRTNRRHTSSRPALQIHYNAKGYFFTRGWDPNLDSPTDFKRVQDDLEYAKMHRNSPEVPQASPDLPEGPPIFLFFNKIPKPEVQQIRR